MPKADLAADCQNGATAWRHRNLVKRALPQLNEHRRVTQELLACRSERSSALMPNEKRASELLFEAADSCAHGCLGDIQPLRSPDEAAGRNDLDESSREFDVHPT